MPGRPSRSALLLTAAITLVVLAWLASQRSYVHRGRLDPAEPIYASNSLEARGYLFPWLIVEVPPELGPVPFSARLDVKNAGVLFLLALTIASCLVGTLALARMAWRRMRGVQ